jgi:hypothetical protein
MKLNVTARAARWSAAHWKTATVLWLAFAVAAVARSPSASFQVARQVPMTPPSWLASDAFFLSVSAVWKSDLADRVAPRQRVR